MEEAIYEAKAFKDLKRIHTCKVRRPDFEIDVELSHLVFASETYDT